MASGDFSKAHKNLWHWAVAIGTAHQIEQGSKETMPSFGAWIESPHCDQHTSIPNKLLPHLQGRQLSNVYVHTWKGYRTTLLLALSSLQGAFPDLSYHSHHALCCTIRIWNSWSSPGQNHRWQAEMQPQKLLQGMVNEFCRAVGFATARLTIHDGTWMVAQDCVFEAGESGLCASSIHLRSGPLGDA